MRAEDNGLPSGVLERGDRGATDFGTGSSRSRNRDQRRQIVPDKPIATGRIVVARQGRLVGGEQLDQLRGIERASAADRDQPDAVLFAVRRNSVKGVFLGGIGIDAIEDSGSGSRSLQDLENPGQQT